MRVHTNEFKEEISKMGREITGRIYYYETTYISGEVDEQMLLTESGYPICSEWPEISDDNKVEISSENIFQMSIIKNGSLLTSLMKQLNFETNVELDIGTVANPQFGLLVDGQYEYLSYGNFIIKEKEQNFDTKNWSYICYDKMLYSMVEYKPLQVSYPITIGNFLQKICERIGIEFKLQNKNGITWTPNNFFQNIYSDVFTGKGLKYRDVLDKISEVLAGNILIDDDDKLMVASLLPFPQEEKYVDTFDETNLKDINVAFNEKVGPINKVVVVDTQSNIEYPYTFGGIEVDSDTKINIVDNELALNGDSEAVARNILYDIAGLEYYLNDFSTTGICYLDYLDRFAVNVENTTYPCLLLNNEITINQGIEENIFTDTQTQVSYKEDKYFTPVMSSNETYLKINKQLGEINSKVSKGDIISAINQSAEQIQIQADKISLGGKVLNLTTENIKISSDHFNVDDNGNTSIISTASTYTGAEFKLIGQSLTNFLYSSAMVIKENSSSVAEAGLELISGKGTLILTDNQGSLIHAVAGQGLDVINGDIYTTGTVTGSNIQSDRRLKKDIKRSEICALDVLKMFEHKQYNWKENNKHVEIGYIAQELEKIDSNFVIKKNDIYYINLLPILATATKAIQELQEEINELKEMIKNG